MTADIICHGTPSPEVFQGWLSALESVRENAVAHYEHRPKTLGWGHVERITWANGPMEQRTRWANAWRLYFYDDRSLRPSCYRCPYTVTDGRPGDVTIADFWGIENTPFSRSDDAMLGVSLVLANTASGLEVLSNVDADFEATPIEVALPRNPMLQRPSSVKSDRVLVWESLYHNGILRMMRRNRFLLSPVRQLIARTKAIIKKILRG